MTREEIIGVIGDKYSEEEFKLFELFVSGYDNIVDYNEIAKKPEVKRFVAKHKLKLQKLFAYKLKQTNPTLAKKYNNFITHGKNK